MKNSYDQLDAWFEQHPKGSHSDFLADYPQSTISYWSFRRRRKNPSAKINKKVEKETRPYNRTASTVYTTPWQIPMEDIDNKSKMEILKEFTDQLNVQFKLHLQLTEVFLVGNSKRVLEVRRYNR
jgi:hypothetical protein